MRNLSVEITQTFSFLNSSKNIFTHMIKLTESIIIDLSSIKPNTENSLYGNKIKTKTEDFKKAFGKEIDKIFYDYKIFDAGMEDIILNRLDEKVIYGMNNYLLLLKYFTELGKKIKKVDALLQVEKEKAERDEDLLKNISFLKIENCVKLQKEIFNSIIDKLERVTNTTIKK